MIVSVAILSKNGNIFCSNHLPYQVKADISKHANNFLYSLSVEDDETELPYIETTTLRYIYKQTEDLYWLLVTKPESDMFTDIHLLGKFVCTIMEYGSSDTNSMTLTDEQRELFYRHIWRPWDEGSQCPFCSCHCNSPGLWEREFDSRLQFLISIRDGHVGEDDINYFTGLIAESWAISAKLSPKWNSDTIADEFTSDSDSVCSNETRNSISEEAVIDGCRLKCRLEDLRLEVVRIQDPYLRLFARRDLLDDTCYSQNNQVSSAPTFKELDSDGQCESDFYHSLHLQ